MPPADPSPPIGPSLSPPRSRPPWPFPGRLSQETSPKPRTEPSSKTHTNPLSKIVTFCLFCFQATRPPKKRAQNPEPNPDPKPIRIHYQKLLLFGFFASKLHHPPRRGAGTVVSFLLLLLLLFLLLLLILLLVLLLLLVCKPLGMM